MKLGQLIAILSRKFDINNKLVPNRKTAGARMKKTRTQITNKKMKKLFLFTEEYNHKAIGRPSKNEKTKQFR